MLSVASALQLALDLKCDYRLLAVCYSGSAGGVGHQQSEVWQCHLSMEGCQEGSTFAVHGMALP